MFSRSTSPSVSCNTPCVCFCQFPWWRTNETPVDLRIRMTDPGQELLLCLERRSYRPWSRLIYPSLPSTPNTTGPSGGAVTRATLPPANMPSYGEDIQHSPFHIHVVGIHMVLKDSRSYPRNQGQMEAYISTPLSSVARAIVRTAPRYTLHFVPQIGNLSGVLTCFRCHQLPGERMYASM